MPTRHTTGFDAVVGNPPFLNQLERRTANDRRVSAMLACRWGSSISAYTDTSSTMLLLAVSIAKAGGRVGFVLPQSFLASRDAGPIRCEVLKHASLEHLWLADGPTFEGTDILTCAPTLHIAGHRHTVLHTTLSLRFDSCTPISIDHQHLEEQETWAPIAARARGVPSISIETTRTIAEVASATADFRDQYYGLAGFIIESDSLEPAEADNWADYPPILTSGLIDPAVCRWAETSTSILKQRWRAPRVDRRAMLKRGGLGPWIASRLIPKIILAIQTRVLEVLVDETGRYLPGLPLITIVPNEADDIWRVASVLASPVASDLALTRYTGVAMSVDSIKLAARQVLTLPMPEPGPALDEAAKNFREASKQNTPSTRLHFLLASAEASCRAFGLSSEEYADVMQWWTARLKRNRSLRDAP